MPTSHGMVQLTFTTFQVEFVGIICTFYFFKNLECIENDKKLFRSGSKNAILRAILIEASTKFTIRKIPDDTSSRSYNVLKSRDLLRAFIDFLMGK